jgi:hypothetical protein
MAGHAVLEEVCAAMQLQEPQQVVLQHTLVAFSIQCEILRQKVEATTAHSAREAVPNHDTIRMLICVDSEATIEPAGALRSPHPVPAGPDAPEGRFI